MISGVARKRKMQKEKSLVVPTFTPDWKLAPHGREAMWL